MSGKRKILFYCFLAIEAFALFILCTDRLKSRENDQIVYSADMLSMVQDGEGGLEVREGTASINNTDQGTNRRIITPAFMMRDGIYAVSIQYQTAVTSASSTGCHSQAVYDGEYPWIHSESVMLTNNNTNIEYFVHVMKDNTDVKIKNIMDDGFYDPVQIDQITVTYLNGRSAIVAAVFLLLFFSVIDVILYLYLYHRKEVGIWIQKNGFIAAALCALLFVVELPMTMNYVPKGYDLRFHFYRIYTISEGLRDGVFPVKIQPEWFNGYGYATGIFYGDILLYIPALLYLLGFSMGLAYKIYILLINIITIGTSYFCFKTVSKDRYIGLFGSIVYTSFLHRLVALYTRAALGAFTALAFVPLVLLGLWAIYYGEEKEYRRSWIYLVIGSAGIVGSHLLGTLMTVLFTALFLLISLGLTLRKKTGLAIGKTAVGCLLANLFYIVPFLDTYRSMTLAAGDYKGNMPVYYNSAFLSQMFSMSFNAIADVKEDLYGMYQDMPMSVGPVSGIILLAAVCFLVYNCGRENKDNGLLVKMMIMTGISIWMSTNLFPYMWLDEFCPVLYAGLKKFQFAWRFLAAASIFITFLYVILLIKAKEFFNRRKVLTVGAVICMLFCYQGVSYLFQYDNLMKPFEYENHFRDLTVRAIYAGEYMPQGTDFQKMTTDILLSGGVDATLLDRNGTAMEVMVENRTDEEAYIELPILIYKGYHAWSDAGELPVSAGENNRLKVAVPSGFDGVVKVAFAEPWYWRGAEIVSLLFWTGLTGYLLARKKITDKYIKT